MRPLLAGLLLLAGCSENNIQKLKPSIRVGEPDAYEGVALGEVGLGDVDIANAGRAPLRVDRVEVDPPFSVTRWDQGTIEAGAQVFVEVSFDAAAAGRFTGSLLVFSDDPDEPIVARTVTAEVLAPEILIDPTRISFSEADGEAEATVYVTNLGPGDLLLDDATLADDGGGAFALPEGLSGLRLQPEDIVSFPVTYAGEGVSEGLVEVRSNDPVSPVAGVDLGVDAIPPVCADLTYPAELVAIDESCVQEVEEGLLDVRREWFQSTYTEHASYRGVMSAPLVGNLTDDNGDGRIDADDDTDIVVSTIRAGGYSAAVLRILHGDGSGVYASIASGTHGGMTYTVTGLASPALGDVDQDGEPEIIVQVGASSWCYVGAFAVDGTLEWVAREAPVDCRQGPVALADLEGDGDVEVVLGALILNGADGSVQAEGEGGQAHISSYSFGGHVSFPIDLDGDGALEVLGGSTVYNPDGSVFCSTGAADGYPAAADLDGDGLGEFVLSGTGAIRVYDTDCTELAAWSIRGGGRGGPPTIADFDGDGSPEIGVAGATWYVVHEVDGAELWAADIIDGSSSATGSSVFDFEGDGVAEVIYADEHSFWILDGPTGAVRFEDDDHHSPTVYEYPTIADVDGDGSAEIVVGRYAYATPSADVGLAVYGSWSDLWQPAREVWNQHAYHITNVDDDLSIPTTQSPLWPRYNSFRSADLVARVGAFDVNAQLELVDVCTDECDAGTLRVVVRVTNEGPTEIEAGLAVVAEDALTGAVVDSVVLGAPVGSGQTTEGLSFDLPTDALSASAVRFVVDPYDNQRECDEEDNELLVADGLCP